MKALLLLAGLPLVAAAASGSTVVAKIAVPGTPCGVGEAAGAVWVSNPVAAKLVRIDPKTYTLTKIRSGGLSSSWIATSGKDVWVSNTGSGTVSRIDAVARRVVSTVKVGLSPVNLDVIDGDVWVPCDLGNTIARIDG